MHKSTCVNFLIMNHVLAIFTNDVHCHFRNIFTFTHSYLDSNLMFDHFYLDACSKDHKR